jgi:hypothetical protein
MAHTVIGIFDYTTQTETALRMLSNKGINSENINVATKEQTVGRGDMTDEVNTLNSNIGRYFERVFGDADKALKYAAVAQQGSVMSVQCETYEEAVKVADILDACGAINVDERARMLEDGMTREDRKLDPQDQQPKVKVFPGVAEYSHASEPSSNDEIRVDERSAASENVRVKSRIVERPVGENTRIREEQIWVEPTNTIDRSGSSQLNNDIEREV